MKCWCGCVKWVWSFKKSYIFNAFLSAYCNAQNTHFFCEKKIMLCKPLFIRLAEHRKRLGLNLAKKRVFLNAKTWYVICTEFACKSSHIKCLTVIKLKPLHLVRRCYFQYEFRQGVVLPLLAQSLSLSRYFFGRHWARFAGGAKSKIYQKF